MTIYMFEAYRMPMPENIRRHPMAVWKLKSCPRCGGDLFLDRDEGKWYEQCLQCSYLRELKDAAEFRTQSVEREKEPASQVGRGERI